MCILSDGSMCVLLSQAEQLAQHNFEERKGPYPKALADRLDAAGIMARERHFKESLQRRRENVEKQLDNRPFSMRMDCSDDERGYMAGNRHDLPMDIFLPQKLAEAMFIGFNQVRKEYFRRYLYNYGNAKHVAFLLAYPEFDEWFSEFSNEPSRSSNNNLTFIIDGLIKAPERLAERMCAITSESVLRKAWALVVYRFFSVDDWVRTPGTLDMMRAYLPTPHHAQFNAICDEWRRLVDIPNTRVFTKQRRRQRKALKKSVRAWALVVRDDPSMIPKAVRNMALQLLTARAEAIKLPLVA